MEEIMIKAQTRALIKGYLEGFIDGLVQQHKPIEKPPRLIKDEIDNTEILADDAGYKPFHQAIIPEQILRISSFERSFSTKLGSTFEECARQIALQTYKTVKRGFV